jgi:hypothetical protein
MNAEKFMARKVNLSLSMKEIKYLARKARKENKICLLVYDRPMIVKVICYAIPHFWSKGGIKIIPLVGEIHSPFLSQMLAFFDVPVNSRFPWTWTQASKSDLLLFMGHKPLDPKIFMDIFNGTLKILEF